MYVDHLLEGVKKGMKLLCRHCGEELDQENWVSEWDNQDPFHNHYKSNTCACGEKKWIRVDFAGTGHDRVLQDKITTIDSAMGDKKGE